MQVPGYLKNQKILKEQAGIDEVLVLCVNDGAVMRGWNEQLLKEYPPDDNNIVTFMGDPTGDFCKACGMLMNHPGPEELGLLGRSKRFALHVDKNIVQYVAVSEAEDDPAGDNDPSATCYDAMLQAILKHKQTNGLV